MSEITIYHNPRCGTSRNTLALIRATGLEPEVVDYTKAGWSEGLLIELLGRLGAKPSDILRKKGAPEEALAKLEAVKSDAEILALMVEYPILVERPIVVTPLGTVLSRPSEVVAKVLENLPQSFTKEDGETVSF